MYRPWSIRANGGTVTEELRQAVVDALESVNADFEPMECDPELADTAVFCEHYGIPPEQSANAIMLASKRPRASMRCSSSSPRPDST